MKYKGKIEEVIIGEILHNVNSPLAVINLVADQLEPHQKKLIQLQVERIAEYLLQAKDKTEWSTDDEQ